LNPGEILLARLNRPIHYLKPRDGRVPVDTWFDPQMLYRIPRNPVTTGIRALGRLAFFDNYRQLAGRLRAELEACTDPEALATAERETKLGLRTNRPRVYIVNSLAGGTGGGMFIDLAYAVRQLLRYLGYSRPEVFGVFLIPPVDRQATQASTLALGNAFAALTELNHFSAPDVIFSARYDEKDGPITDREAPFTRTVLLPLAEEGDSASAHANAGLAAELLARELISPLGRTADTTRAALAASWGLGTRLSCQSVGLYRFSWPRRVLLQRAGRNLCERLVQRWISKDPAPVREAVQNWVAEQWAKYELGPEHLINRLQHACERAVGQSPEAAFTDLVQPLIPKGRRAPEPDPGAIQQALEKLEGLVGRPDENPVNRRASTVADALGPAADAALKEWGHRISQFPVALIERPDFRLAGAEESIRQLVATIERALEHHEPLGQELAEQAANAYSRIHMALNTLRANPGGGRRMAPVIQELGEVLQLYPKWRYQSLVLQRVNKTYVSLRGQLSDQLREVGFCRQRLGELARSFEDAGSVSRTSSERGPCRFLLPAGCQSISEAVKRVLDEVTPDDLKKLDQQIQGMIKQQFTALVHICMTSSNLLRNLEVAMQQQAEAFVSGRLAGANVAEMFLAQYPAEKQASEHLVTAFDEAAPKLNGAGPVAFREIQILALPTGPNKERFTDMLHKGLPESDFHVIDSADDIVFYRELPHLPLASLAQLGPQGYEAYSQLLNRDRFTPHTRMDIAEWLAIRE